MFKTPKTVLLFGSFDYFHEGHRYLIEQAKQYGQKIIIVVAQDNIIYETKGKRPHFTLHERMDIIKKQFPKLIVLEGDKKNNSWSIIKKYKPEIIITGYDQNELRKALLKIQEQYHFKIITIKAYQPKKYKSSLLKTNNY